MRQRWENARLGELLDGMSWQEFTLRSTLYNPDLDDHRGNERSRALALEYLGCSQGSGP